MEAPSTPVGAPWLQRARDFIEANYGSELRIADVAAQAGVSRVHLTRAYGATYGLTPHVHLHALRLLRAMAMLERGESIALVAVSVGYADQSHFTRRFKDAFGVTPGAWLQARAGQAAARRGAICAGS